mgnify:CR=1 FL=1
MNKIELTEEEIKTLKNIDQSSKRIIEELGRITINELELERRKERAEDYYFKLKTRESEVAKQLEAKYGKGTVDIVSGVFLPLN